MELFFSIFIVTIVFFSLRVIDRIRCKKIKDNTTKEEQIKLRKIGFFE